MLKLHPSEESSNLEGSTDSRKWENEKDSLPSLSTGLLLHPQTGLFPFPSYFSDLHSFLVKFTKARLKPRYENPQELERSLGNPVPKISLEGLEHCFSNKSEYSTLQVNIATELIPSLLPELDDEGVHLLLYHLEPLFLNQETRLYAFTHLFDLIAQAIGPKATAKTFLRPLIELYDSKMLHNYEHLAAQSFLSQIIVRFGLENFLTHFASFVVDAVAFELMLQKTKRSADRNSVNSNDGITVDGGESEAEKSKNQKQIKKPLYPSDDEDEDVGNTDAPFSDQEEDEYAPRIDEPINYEEQEDLHKPVLSRQEAEEDALPEQGKDTVIFIDDQTSDDKNKDEIQWHLDEVGHDETLDEEAEQSRDDELNLVSSVRKEDVTNKHEQIEEQLQNEESVSSLTGEQPTTQEDEVVEDNSKETVTKESSFDDSEDDKQTDKDDETEDLEETSTKEEDSIVKRETREKEERRKEDDDDDDGDGDDDGDAGDGDGGDGDDDGDDDGDGGDGGDGDGDGDDDGDGGDGDDAPSGNESDDESSGNFKESEEDSEPSRPSADVFYQDTKPDSKEYEPPKEDLSTSYVSGIAAESVMWLAPRLGPILTSKYFANQLLTMLPQCYIDVVGVEEYEFEDEDRKAKWVLYCLGNFCALYGEAFVLHQYLPYAEKVVSIN